MTHSTASCILFIGSRTENYEKFVQELNSALSLKNPALCEVIEGFRDLPFFLSSHHLPALIFVENDQSLSAERFEKIFLNFLESKKEILSDCPVFAIRSELPPVSETQKWLEKGLTGFLQKELTVQGLEDVYQENLQKKLEQKPRFLRLSAPQKLELKIVSLEQAIASEIFNLGIGGFFIRDLPNDLQIGSRIEFHFEMSPFLSDSSQGSNPLEAYEEKKELSQNARISGEAIVTWTRPFADATGPRGFGAQFLNLPEESKRILSHFLAHRAAQSFIPKS